MVGVECSQILMELVEIPGQGTGGFHVPGLDTSGAEGN
jgi:hypothetical protein